MQMECYWTYCFNATNSRHRVGWSGHHIRRGHHGSKLLPCSYQSLLDVLRGVKILASLTPATILSERIKIYPHSITSSTTWCKPDRPHTHSVLQESYNLMFSLSHYVTNFGLRRSHNSDGLGLCDSKLIPDITQYAHKRSGSRRIDQCICGSSSRPPHVSTSTDNLVPNGARISVIHFSLYKL